jgi:phosphate-selective porin OprO/OprP
VRSMNPTAALATLALIVLAQTAQADAGSGASVQTGGGDCGDSVTAEILTILKNAGNINQGQFDALCRKARGEAETVAATPAVEGEGPTWDFKWDNGFKLARSDKKFKLKFGGRIHLDGTFISADSDLASDFRDAGLGSTDGNGVDFRRARLFFSGTLYERLFFNMQYDFAQPNNDDNPDFKDVYVGLKLGPVKDLRVGHFKEPMMLDEWTSSKFITFMERGLNQVFFPGRNVGLMAAGDAVEKRLFWQTGIFRNTNDQGFAFDDWDDTEWDLAARLVGVPLYSGEGENLIHLGASYVHRFMDWTAGGNLRYRRRPSSHLAQRFVDTRNSLTGIAGADIQAGDSDILNLEAAGVFGPFSVQAEYTNSWVNGGGLQDNLHFWGLYAQASWFLTGEHRPYDLGNGRFGRLKPKNYFNPAEGGWGAWEIAARYSYLSLRDRNVRGGRLWDVTAALNWYLYPNFRWMLNYVHAHVGDRVSGAQTIRGGADIVQSRFALDF